VKLPILSVLRDECAFSPEETKTCVLAFEEAIRYLGWVKRSDPIASEIARQSSLVRSGVNEILISYTWMPS
jgi:hypothetical protein